MEYEMVAGLEIHARIKSQTKMFCSCSNDTFGKSPNTHICPVCTGFPGALPVVNKEAIHFGILTALALNCTIPSFSKFDRKSYFYPDLPSGFQISQFDQPVSEHGSVSFLVKGEKRSIRINRLHLENDAGKMVHEGEHSLVDLNRAGSPLMEMVTEADFRSPEEIVAFLKELQKILRTLGSSYADMEKGQMRCDVNISLRPKGQEEFGTKAEIKNMNSFGNIEKAVRSEVIRQRKILESGEKVKQETRGWDADKGVSHGQRSKEEAADYRYFPEPDLPPLTITTEDVEAIRKTLPELPTAKQERFVSEYKIDTEKAEILATDRSISEYFETAARISKSPKRSANWICSDLLGVLKESGQGMEKCPFSAENMGKLVGLIEKGVISGKMAKDLFPELLEKNANPEKIVEERGLAQSTDTGEIESWCNEVIAENENIVQTIREGKDRAIGALVGQVMKKSRGQANPQMVNDILKKKIMG